jgi:hypothetical protein
MCRSQFTNNSRLYISDLYRNNISVFNNIDHFILDYSRTRQNTPITTLPISMPNRLIINNYKLNTFDRLTDHVSLKINTLPIVNYIFYITIPFIYLAIYL